MSGHLSLTACASFYAAACSWKERVAGGGSGAPPSAMSRGGGSGAPPSAQIVAFAGQLPKPADPAVMPNTITNPRHTNRILPKCIVSSSEVHGARKEPNPKRETCVEPTLCPRFRFEGKEIWLAFQPKSDISMDRALSRSMTTVERMRDLTHGNRHFVRVFHMAVLRRSRCALHSPLVAITSGLFVR